MEDYALQKAREVKLVIDLIYKGNVNFDAKAEMKRVLADIQGGRFVKNFILDIRAGQPELKAARKAAAAHQIEEVGSKLRAMMPWIGKNQLVGKAKN